MAHMAARRSSVASSRCAAADAAACCAVRAALSASVRDVTLPVPVAGTSVTAAAAPARTVPCHTQCAPSHTGRVDECDVPTEHVEFAVDRIGGRARHCRHLRARTSEACVCAWRVRTHQHSLILQHAVRLTHALTQHTYAHTSHLLTKLDLPTLGCPMTAMRIGCA
jgi:hypothetical protein